MDTPPQAPATIAPLPATAALAGAVGLKEPRLSDGWLFWLEQRPSEGGRCTLLRRRAGYPHAPVQELTPAPLNLRSRVHGYGGGVYAIGGGQVVFIADADRCLWILDLPESDGGQAPIARRLTPTGDPASPRGFADGLIDSPRQRWIGVMEQQGRDHLVAVPLTGGEPQILRTAADFCGYAVLSPDGRGLAWVEWQQPFMPWDRSQLWLASLHPDGQLVRERPVAGADRAATRGVSVFQPLWVGTDLVVANDRSGWWTLERLQHALDRPDDADDTASGWQPLLSMQAEFAMPQWVYGMATTAWDGAQLLAAACVEGSWQLGRIPLGYPDPRNSGDAAGVADWQPFDLPLNDLAYLTADAGRLVAVASGPDRPPGLLELDLASQGWEHRPAGPLPLRSEAISRPEPLWFEGFQRRPTHAWYYPPVRGGRGPGPLLVRGHSGPTGMARTGFQPNLHYWTTRGWGVVEVNYGGSTGFGRAYRERLDGGWGVVDVEDCLAAVRTLVASGRVDPQRVAMDGGSAAGFTVLEALARDRTIKAGCCRYPVTDLSALAQDAGDHRFEARYFDTLVGPWPETRDRYEARSPLRHPERIDAPVIFFHGLDDGVVPPSQTEAMAAALQRKGIEVELHRFPGEGHGFRNQTVQQEVLERTEAFFRRQFGL